MAYDSDRGLDQAQMGLAAAGMIPGPAGIAADLTDAGISLSRGELLMAMLAGGGRHLPKLSKSVRAFRAHLKKPGALTSMRRAQKASRGESSDDLMRALTETSPEEALAAYGDLRHLDDPDLLDVDELYRLRDADEADGLRALLEADLAAGIGRTGSESASVRAQREILEAEANESLRAAGRRRIGARGEVQSEYAGFRHGDDPDLLDVDELRHLRDVDDMVEGARVAREAEAPIWAGGEAREAGRQIERGSDWLRGAGKIYVDELREAFERLSMTWPQNAALTRNVERVLKNDEAIEAFGFLRSQGDEFESAVSKAAKSIKRANVGEAPPLDEIISAEARALAKGDDVGDDLLRQMTDEGIG